jgi:hypothetical protein
MNRQDERSLILQVSLLSSLSDKARVLAHRGGLSLTRFINLALEERISRFEHEASEAIAERQRMDLAAVKLKKSFYN